MSRLKDYTEFSFAALRTIAAVMVVTFMIVTPKPIAIIVPGPYPTMNLPMNFTSTFSQETIPDYGDKERRNPVVEYDVQVTGGEYSKLGQRNLYEEVRNGYYIITRNCNQSSLMDFAVIRVNEDNGWVEIEWEVFHTTCEVMDTTFNRPKAEDIPYP